MSRVNSKALEWQFDHHVSAAGWISQEELLIASEIELFRFNVETRARTRYSTGNGKQRNPFK